jgi:hypothetical protein
MMNTLVDSIFLFFLFFYKFFHNLNIEKPAPRFAILKIFGLRGGSEKRPLFAGMCAGVCKSCSAAPLSNHL